MIARQRIWVVSLGTLLSAYLSLCSVDVKAQDPSRWNDVIRVFATADAACPPPRNAIVFTGSSTIVFWRTIHADMAPLTVINRGFGGSTMQDAIFWLDPLVLKYEPRAVVVYEGDNDIGLYNMTPEQVFDGYKNFVHKVHQQLPQTRIYFLAIKPSILRSAVWAKMKRANDLIRNFCENHPKLHFVDVATPMLSGHESPPGDIFERDKLHLNAKGYALWTSIIKPLLLEHEGLSDQAGDTTAATSKSER